MDVILGSRLFFVEKLALNNGKPELLEKTIITISVLLISIVQSSNKNLY